MPNDYDPFGDRISVVQEPPEPRRTRREEIDRLLFPPPPKNASWVRDTRTMTAHGVSAIALALLEVADAIREATGRADD